MSSSSSSEENVETVLDAVEIESSGEEPPMSEWSSLTISLQEENKKRALHAKGLYSPGSGEVCGKYITMSDSEIFKHHYYNYPAVHDPGIMNALLTSDKPTIYADDGRDLYIALCEEMNTPVVRMFHSGLSSDVISLSYYGLDPYAVRPIALALQYNKSVRRLDLSGNFLNDDACFHLSQMLTTNTVIKELNLSGCRIEPSGILRLGSTLGVNRSLEVLNLSKNCMGEEGGIHFAKQIGDGAGVPRINLSYNELGRLSAFALAEALEYRNKITHLDLSWNNFFHAPSAVKMFEQLADSDVLEELNLSWNSLEGERIAGAISSLLLIPKLKILNLSNNRLKDEAITLIISKLMKAKKLSTIDFSFNPLSTTDAYAVLEKMLRPRVKVDTLLMEGISVEKKFLGLLEKVMKMKCRKNFSVKHGRVLSNWTIEGPNVRTVLLERASYLGRKDKKRRVDIALFFLRMYKEYPKPIPVKTLMDQIDLEKVPLDEDLINEMAGLFPGPKSAKTKLINIEAVCEYIHRIWPEKKLPPTPPPEPEPEPEPEPPPPPPKGKKGKKK
ncbi:unnamed protein product [Diatraea saccharalis]|uniref:Uncharacterized protein n=1 Tax=Diatraea saccharalis TaxID=40085 RepID=A0A9N9W8B1_9NEOP|nr:unnamed protein product [Diatraea saccharalis]